MGIARRSFLYRLAAVAALAAVLLAHPGPAQAQSRVDLELLLAVDASSSVNPWEFDLQMRGIAAAFRDDAVQGAIAGAGDRGVAVAMMQWSSRDRQAVAIDWMVVFDAASAEEFAAIVDATPRYLSGGSTALGSALRFALRMLNSSPYAGTRRVVDVSGDGRTNQGIPASIARDEAVAAGVIVNGLAILNEDPGLDLYYRDRLIGGPGAFVLSAVDYEDFARAIRLKLIREMAGPPLVELAPEQDALPLRTVSR